MDGRSNPGSRIGSTVADKYELVRVLGTGGMGDVFEAVHQFTNRRVALKVMHARFAASPEAGARFLREAQAPTSIGHPALVEVLDAGREDDGSLYMALELLEGEDLAAAMRARRCDEPLTVEVALQLLDALTAAHAQGFVHRDIKPANVFLSPDPARGVGGVRVRLLDFGIARKASRNITEGLTAAGSILGTPDYMSPEQGRGEPVDARADVWSVGAVLFHALAGRPPFEGPNLNVLLATICSCPAPSLRICRPDLPASLIAVVDRALASDVDARWQSAAEMADALRIAARELPASGRVPSARVGVPSASNSAPTLDAAAPIVVADPPTDAPTVRRHPRPRRARASWRTAATLAVVLLVVAAVAARTSRAAHTAEPPPATSTALAAPRGAIEPSGPEPAAPDPQPPSAHDELATATPLPPPPTGDPAHPDMEFILAEPAPPATTPPPPRAAPPARAAHRAGGGGATASAPRVARPVAHARASRGPVAQPPRRRPTEIVRGYR